MSVTAPNALKAVPVADSRYVTVHASGTGLEVNPGDYVSFSGQYGIASHDGVAYYKASGVGIALDRNPAYDWAGRPVVNSALLVDRGGTHRVSASFSGQPNLGVLAFPDMTGSGVNAPSGQTGLGTVWNTGLPVLGSANPTGAPPKGVAQVVAWYAAGNGGTGELDIVLWDRNADYY